MILELNSKPVSALKTFSYEISKLAPKSEILLTIWRNGNIITQKAVVESFNNNDIKTEKQISFNKGKLSVELGAYFDGFKITGFSENSQMLSKGVAIGDEIIKINGNHISSVEDFYLSTKEAFENNGLIHFDMKSVNGDKYFVEIKFDK